MANSDPDISLVFFTSKPPGIPQSNIKVDMSEEYNRKILPDHEKRIDTIWTSRCKENCHLFNGSKFRFHSIIRDNNSNQVVFRLGLTGYKDFISTNWAENAKDLLELGKQNHNNSQAYMSDALGVGAFVLTSDDYVTFIRRSERVGEAQGLWDIPGGHPEPEEIRGGARTVEDIVITNLSADEVVNELFDSTIREIRDEINVPREQLDEAYLMGLAVNHTSSGRPSAEFFVRCRLSSTEVSELYNTGGAEADESSGLKLIHLKDIPKLETTEFWKQMAPSGKGCVQLYTSMMTDGAGE